MMKRHRGLKNAASALIAGSFAGALAFATTAYAQQNGMGGSSPSLSGSASMNSTSAGTMDRDDSSMNSTGDTDQDNSSMNSTSDTDRDNSSMNSSGDQDDTSNTQRHHRHHLRSARNDTSRTDRDDTDRDNTSNTRNSGPSTTKMNTEGSINTNGSNASDRDFGQDRAEQREALNSSRRHHHRHHLRAAQNMTPMTGRGDGDRDDLQSSFKGSRSSTRMSAEGTVNTNGRNASDRDFGQDRAEQREAMNVTRKHHHHLRKDLNEEQNESPAQQQHEQQQEGNMNQGGSTPY